MDRRHRVRGDNQQVVGLEVSVQHVICMEELHAARAAESVTQLEW